METYDAIMLAVLAAATIYGAVKGLAWQVASIASLLASYFFAFQGRTRLAQYIHAEFPWNIFVAMFIVYLITNFGIWLIFRLIADIIDRLRLKEFDRQMGAMLGFGKGALLCILATLFAVTLLGESQRNQIVHSKSGKYIAKLLHDAGPVMPSEVKLVIRPYLENLERQIDAETQPESAFAPGNRFPGMPAAISNQ